jgi:lipoprotein-releasing system permease protein
MRGVMVRGIDPVAEAQVTPLAAQMQPVLAQLQPGQWGVVVGLELARSLGVQRGDVLTLVAPSGQVTPAGVVPRLKQVTVVGVFQAGHYEYDSGVLMMHVQDAAKLFRTGGPMAVQLKLKQATEARVVGNELAESLGSEVIVRDWTRTNANWFDAVQVEKRMMFIILTLIVAVAAFNLVSTLVMTVTDKQADIAILRTLGASPRSIMGIFMVQGALSGVMGTVSGLGLGLLVACNIDVIVPFIERLLGVNFLPGSIYLISKMPSEPQSADIIPIGVLSLLLSLLATLYPSWRASRVQPAQALRYE